MLRVTRVGYTPVTQSVTVPANGTVSAKFVMVRTAAVLSEVVASFLPTVMRLPEGVLLLGPVFFLLQVILGRRQGPTGAEWLWVAWITMPDGVTRGPSFAASMALAASCRAEVIPKSGPSW